MINSIAQHSYFDKKPNKWMVSVQIYLSIGWVHPKCTHVILHTHFVMFEARAFESTLFFLVYRLFYMLYYSFSQTLTIIIFLYGGHTEQSQHLWVWCSHHWKLFVSLVLLVPNLPLPHLSCFLMGFVFLASCFLLCHPTLSFRHLCMLWSPPPPHW